MTVKELKEFIKDLPDDMIVCSLDVGGYPGWEFCGADVVTPDTPPDRYPTPPPPYLMICS